MTETDENRDPPEWTDEQIQEAMQLLLDLGVVLQARFNFEPSDRPWQVRHGSSMDAQPIYQIDFTRAEVIAFLVGAQLSVSTDLARIAEPSDGKETVNG